MSAFAALKVGERKRLSVTSGDGARASTHRNKARPRTPASKAARTVGFAQPALDADVSPKARAPRPSVARRPSSPPPREEMRR
jgi:hypothetical protein